MKLTQHSIGILQNFSGINDNIMLRPGSTQKTMSNTKSVLAEAELDLGLEENIAIYSLSKLLKLVKCISNPSLEVMEGGYSLRIFNNTSEESIEFRLSEASMVVTPPEKPLNLPSEDVSVTITKLQLAKATKVAAALGVDTVAITGDGESVYLRVLDKKNTGSDTYKVKLDETENTFNFYVKLENLKMMDGTYEFTISKSKLARVENLTEDILYYVAMEPDSEWNELENNYSAEVTEEEETEEDELATEELEELIPA